MSELTFDGSVVIVTGAGHGVGRAHALEFARRGAKVVVNDLGGNTDGTGGSQGAAADVVEEIKAAGGEAVANFQSVATPEGGESITQTALDAFGRVDVVVSNAGILRDRTFAKLSVADLDAVLDVHLRGSFFVCGPAFRWMKENGGGGRIVITSSASGLFGNFGQSNYAAAKLGAVGLMRVMALEGARNGINVNAIAPMANTRLTGAGEPEADDDVKSPARVTPLVVALAHPSCEISGETFLAGYGIFSRVWVALGPGWAPGDEVVSAEDIAEHWDAIRDASSSVEVANAMATTDWLQERLAAQ